MARGRSRPRASTRRRAASRRRSSKTSKGGGLTGSAVAAVVLALAAVNWLAARPGLLTAVLVVLAVAGVVAGVVWLVWIRSVRRRRNALSRSVAAADRLSGPEFEQWVAALMRRTGFTRVHVSGGAGDLGADILAVSPGGWRVVVQCKRYQVGRSVDSPDVQKLAGTASAIHDADLAAIVTTSSFTAPARDTAARLGIGLVDREALARWATDGLLPVALARPTAPDPSAPPLPRATRSRRPPARRPSR